MKKTFLKIENFRFFYEIIFFIILSLISYFNFSVSEDDYYFHFLLLDFKHGYMTRGFMGEIVSWFTDDVSKTTAVVFVSIGLLLLNIVISLIFGKLIKNSEGDIKGTYIIIISLFILSPMYFRWLAKNGLQTDLYFYLFTFASVLILKNKVLKWLIPVFAIAATLFSVVYPIHCMTLIAIILLYEFSKERNLSNGVLCVLTYVGIIGVAVFAISKRSSLTFSNVDELYEYMSSKVAPGTVLDEGTVKYYIGEYFLSFKQAVTQYMFLEISRNLKTIIFSFIFIYLPFIIAISVFWIKCIIKTSDWLNRLIYVFAIAVPFLILFPFIFTGEPGRWSAAAFVVEAGLLIYFLYNKNGCVHSLFIELINKIKNKPYIAIASLLYYIVLSGR